jgi:hypothetical protein
MYTVVWIVSSNIKVGPKMWWKASSGIYWTNDEQFKTVIYTVQLKGTDKFWAWVPHTKTRKNVTCVQKYLISELQSKVVKMSSIRFNCTYRHISPWTAAPNTGVVVDSLTGIYNVTVKSLFVVNRSCIHTQRFSGVPTVKIQRIQLWWAWRPCSGFSSTRTLVMTGVNENFSHSTAKLCRSTIMHVNNLCSDCQWYIFQ